MKKMVIPIVLLAVSVPLISLADGRTDYKARCAGCHGADAIASPKKAKVLKVDFKKLVLSMSDKNKAEMVEMIKKGTTIMPGFEKEMTDEQISAVVDYVLRLNKR